MMLSYSHILRRLEEEIKALAFNSPPPRLYEPVRYILSLGGKRLRPVLTVMACNLFDKRPDDAFRPALGLEMFHNFTLLHDDLMDKADKRRNKPTVHKVWDENTAILSGDAMLIEAYRLIGQTRPDCLKEVLDLFTVTASEICGGQQFDMDFETRDRVEEAEYLEMIRLKTAVLLGAALKTGAIVGRADPEDAEKLYRFGICIGMAFQLQDDLLDVYGDPATFGKNIGGDIVCNKKTFLLINAFRLADKGRQEALKAWTEKTSVDPKEKIEAVTAIYNDLGIRQLTEKTMHRYYDEGMECLDSLSVEKEKTAVLREVAARLMGREY